MKSRIIWMLLTGLGLAGALSIVISYVQPFNSEPTAINTQDSPEISEPGPALMDVNKAYTPAIFSLISETDRVLNMSGTSEPDAVISILNHGERLRQIRAGADGVWATQIDIQDIDVLFVELVMFLGDGTIVRGDETLIRVPQPRTENTADTNTASSPLSLLLVTAPGGPSRVVQTPFGGAPTSGPLSMGPVDYDDRGGVIFSGTSELAGRIRIYGNDAVIGETRVADGGRWFFIAGETLPLGSYEIAAELTRENGGTSRITIPFKRLGPVASAERTQNPFVKFGPYSWHVRRNLTGGGAQYTAIYAPAGTPPLPLP